MSPLSRRRRDLDRANARPVTAADQTLPGRRAIAFPPSRESILALSPRRRPKTELHPAEHREVFEARRRLAAESRRAAAAAAAGQHRGPLSYRVWQRPPSGSPRKPPSGAASARASNGSSKGRARPERLIGAAAVERFYLVPPSETKRQAMSGGATAPAEAAAARCRVSVESVWRARTFGYPSERPASTFPLLGGAPLTVKTRADHRILRSTAGRWPQQQSDGLVGYEAPAPAPTKPCQESAASAPAPAPAHVGKPTKADASFCLATRVAPSSWPLSRLPQGA